MTNLFHDVPASLPSELIQTLLATSIVRIERIVSLGHASPEGFWYDQDRPEWVLVLQGAARLRFEGETPLVMLPGDCIDIPAHKRHRVEWTDPTGPTVWLAIHYEADADATADEPRPAHDGSGSPQVVAPTIEKTR